MQYKLMLTVIVNRTTRVTFSPNHQPNVDPPPLLAVAQFQAMNTEGHRSSGNAARSPLGRANALGITRTPHHLPAASPARPPARAAPPPPRAASLRAPPSRPRAPRRSRPQSP
eukprot:5958732-Prymnesium_polylepis.1